MTNNVPGDHRHSASDAGAHALSLLSQAWRAAADSGAPAMLLAADPADGGRGAPVVQWVSRSLADLFRLDDSELLGQPLSELTHLEPSGPHIEDGWVGVLEGLIRLGRGRRPVHGLSAIGSEFSGSLEVVPITAEGLTGWLVTLVCAGGGTDDRDEKLREAQARFTALAESAPIGILLSEVGLRLGYVNDIFADLCGAASYQLNGTDWLEVFHPDDERELRLALERVLGGRKAELNLRLRQDNESPRWIHLRLGPIVTPSRAAGFIGVAEDITERRAWENKITYQANHDSLTGLVNRRQIIEVLRGLLASRRGRDRRFAVMFIDLDGFKAINDTHGHDVGDRVLVEVSRRMRRVARAYDMVGRVAGDEFVVLLRDVYDPDEAAAAARRQLEALEAPIHWGADELDVSASIGVAMPHSQDTVESLLQTADHAMYEAKKAGGSGYRLAWTHEPDPEQAPWPTPPSPRAPVEAER